LLKANHSFISEQELEKINKVTDSGKLTGFSGTLGKGDYKYLQMDSKKLISHPFLGGEMVQNVERMISNIVDSSFCVFFNSATSALFALFSSLNSSKKNIVVPTLSFSATASAVAAAGYNPIFVDIDNSSNLNPIALEKTLDGNSDIAAVVFVQWGGNSTNLIQTKQICDKFGIPLFEDSSQATLSPINSESYNGMLGLGGVFSFNGPKNLSCGEGGCIVTNDPDIAFFSRLTRNHAEAIMVEGDIKTERCRFGYNLRPTEISCGLASAQIDRREILNSIRQNNKKFLDEHFKKKISASTTSSPYIPYSAGYYTDTPETKKLLKKELTKKDINIFFGYPIEHWEMFGKLNLDHFPGTKLYKENCFTVYQIGFPNSINEMKNLAENVNLILEG